MQKLVALFLVLLLPAVGRASAGLSEGPWVIAKRGEKVVFHKLPLRDYSARQRDRLQREQVRRRKAPVDANRVYVYSDTYGPTKDAILMLKDRRYYRQKAENARGRLGEAEVRAMGRVRAVLEGLLDKGYTLVYFKDARPTDFVRGVGDPKSVALFHEGHSGIRRAHESKSGKDEVYLLFDDEEKRWGLDGRHVPRGFKPSPRLRFIVTNACQAGRCEAFYRQVLQLPARVKWDAGWENQSAFTILERFSSSVSQLADQLPAR